MNFIDTAQTTYYRNLGARISLQRKKMRMTALALAERIGVHRNTLSRYEAGQERLPVLTLARIARALDSPVYTFLPDMGARQVAAARIEREIKYSKPVEAERDPWAHSDPRMMERKA